MKPGREPSGSGLASRADRKNSRGKLWVYRFTMVLPSCYHVLPRKIVFFFCFHVFSLTGFRQKVGCLILSIPSGSLLPGALIAKP